MGSDAEELRTGENAVKVETKCDHTHIPGEEIQDCGNYRGIKLMSHTMQIWERTIDRRMREEDCRGAVWFPA